MMFCFEIKVLKRLINVDVIKMLLGRVDQYFVDRLVVVSGYGVALSASRWEHWSQVV